MPSLTSTVHAMTRDLINHVAPGDGDTVPPAVGYPVLFSIVHQLWHTEDLIHTRNVHGLPPPKRPLLRPHLHRLCHDDRNDDRHELEEAVCLQRRLQRRLPFVAVVRHRRR